MIKQVADAVKAKFDANVALKGALTGGLWFTQAPQNVGFPYAVFYMLGGTRDEIMGTAEQCVKNVDVQINIFGNLRDGGSQIAELSTLCTDCYNWVDLTVADYSSVFVSPEGLPIIQCIDDVWQATCYYTIGVEKT